MLKINFLLDGILCTKDSVYNKRASFDCLERRSRRRKLRKSLVVVKIRNIWVTSSVAPRQNIRGGLTGKNSTIRRAVFGAQYSALFIVTDSLITFLTPICAFMISIFLSTSRDFRETLNVNFSF